MTRHTIGMMCSAGVPAGGLPSAREAWRAVSLPGEEGAPALGMGSWRLAPGIRRIDLEENAVTTGLSFGMTLIVTAAM